MADFNLDARQEVKLENDRVIAFVRPAGGGHLYELDVRHCQTNVLATLQRRPEAYHGAIAASARGESEDGGLGPSIQEGVVLKQEGLDRRIVYDLHPRKALVDHFYPLDVTLDDLVACRDVERGDFASGTYLAKVVRAETQVALTMERPGVADGHAVRLSKTVTLSAGSPSLDVHYVLEDLPVGVPVHFAVEMNLAGMAGHADDRSYSSPDGRRLGLLDSRLDLDESSGVSLTDEWLDLGIGLRWSVPGGLWCHPIETVSQSEGGFEAVYQGSAAIPHWIVSADDSRRWEVRISLTVDRAETSRQHARSEGEEGRKALELMI